MLFCVAQISINNAKIFVEHFVLLIELLLFFTKLAGNIHVASPSLHVKKKIPDNPRVPGTDNNREVLKSTEKTLVSPVYASPMYAPMYVSPVYASYAYHVKCPIIMLLISSAISWLIP